MRMRRSSLLLAAFGWAFCAQSQTVTFDFDTGTPALTAGQSVPFDQTAGGLTAQFSSPSGQPIGSAFSIQNSGSTGWRLSRFSGNYLAPNSTTKSTLKIKFSQPVTSIRFAFATVDYQVEVPTSLQLTAYSDAAGTVAAGSVTARGAYGSDSFPMGVLMFESGTPFYVVQIATVSQTGGGGPEHGSATVFHLDNIVAGTTPGSAMFSSVCSASYMNGPVAPEVIASGFGSALAATSESATSLALPLTLANTAVTVTDSAGVPRAAPLYHVSPGQINYVVPAGSAGGVASVRVTSGGQTTGTGSVLVQAVAPGIFTANADGRGAPAAYALSLAPDSTLSMQQAARCGASAGSCVPASIDLGPEGTQVFLVLFGTGIRGRSSLPAVTARIGGVNAQVQYAGPQPEFAGLDQVNVVLPRELAARGEVDVALAVDGIAANTVRVNFK